MPEPTMSNWVERSKVAPKNTSSVSSSGERHEEINIASLNIEGIEELNPNEISQETVDPIVYAIRANELVDAYQNYLKEKTQENYGRLAELALDVKIQRGHLFKNQKSYRQANSIMRNQYRIGTVAAEPEYLDEIISEKDFPEQEFLTPKDPADKIVYEAIRFFDKERMTKRSRLA